MDSSLIKFILPAGMLEYFQLNNVTTHESIIHIHLEENNTVPEEYKAVRLTSKGFYDEIKVQDFPLRGKKVFLLVKRRRWLNEDTGDIVHRNWDLVAQGTRMTQEFASFLKVIVGYQTGKL